MALTPEAINKMLKRYISSDKGKAVTKEYIEDCIAKGIRLTGGSGKLTTVVEMEDAARKLMTSIQNTASSFGLDWHTLELIGSLAHTAPAKMPDGSYQVEIYFTGDKHRESLYPKGYPDGVENIVALLNNGFKIGSDKKQAFGKWYGIPTRGLRSREGLHFIQTAVYDFNAVYGDVYNATVWVDPVYED